MKLTKNENNYILRCAKKMLGINHLGGKCEICGCKDFEKLVFHHNYMKEKEFEPTKMFAFKNFNEIKNELDKCLLLCHNCHNEIHDSKHEKNRHKNNKKLLLDFIGTLECSLCGYNKSYNSLHFHHKEDKKFWLGNINIRLKSINDITTEIENELNKCSIVCANCHYSEHFDTHKFKKYENEIRKRIITYSPKNKIDYDKVKNTIENGGTQKDIMELFSVGKGAAHYAYHKIINGM